MVAGIPTTYRYNAMRSRLEARWASFFDLIGWPWTYEPLDADGYIPDFLIHGPNNEWSSPVTPRPCNHGAQFMWDPGSWAVCGRGQHLSVYHSVGSYHTRPCGDGHEPPDADPNLIRDLWAQAGSRVQWKPAA